MTSGVDTQKDIQMERIKGQLILSSNSQAKSLHFMIENPTCSEQEFQDLTFKLNELIKNFLKEEFPTNE